jgi:hypothetical protein
MEKPILVWNAFLPATCRIAVVVDFILVLTVLIIISGDYQTMFAVLTLALIASVAAIDEQSNNLYCSTEDAQLYVYRVPKHSCSCSAKSEGTLRYHNKKLQICDGGKYVDVSGDVPTPAPTPAPTPPPTTKPTPAPTPPPELGSEKNPGTSCNDISSKRRYYS